MASKKQKSGGIVALRWIAIVPAYVWGYVILLWFFPYMVGEEIAPIFSIVKARGYNGHSIIGPPILFLLHFACTAIALGCAMHLAPSKKLYAWGLVMIIHLFIISNVFFVMDATNTKASRVPEVEWQKLYIISVAQTCAFIFIGYFLWQDGD